MDRREADDGTAGAGDPPVRRNPRPSPRPTPRGTPAAPVTRPAARATTPPGRAGANGSGATRPRPPARPAPELAVRPRPNAVRPRPASAAPGPAGPAGPAASVDPRPGPAASVDPRPGPAEPARSRLPRPLAVDPRSFEVPAPGSEPPPPAAPDAVPDAPGEPRRPRRVRRRLLQGALVLLVLTVAVVGTGVWYAWKTFGKIERVAVADVLTPESGGETNYLIVGTDSRDGLGDDVENRDVVVGDGVAGQRSDTIVLMRVGKDGNRMLPVPRDLWLPIVDTKGSQRINTAIQGGPARLIKTVQQSLALPVHHYVEIDFAGFLGLVDAVGGVDIEFDAPAFDDKSGLNITTAGVHKLDKDMALAYVRSRAYTRIVDGKKVVDPTADLGRIQRQQTFLRAVMAEVGATRNPLTLAHIGDAIATNMKIDDALGFTDSLGLARKLAGLNPETVDLPVTPTRTKGGADVLLLKQPAATAALDRFR